MHGGCCFEKKILGIDQVFPDFQLKAVKGGENENNTISEVKKEDFKGKWLLVFFYPLDFTFVCPTELIELNKIYDKFKEKNCEVISVSTDSVYSHLNWKEINKNIGKISFAMVSDLNRKLSKQLNILNNDGVCNRVTYLINPDGIIQWMEIFPSNVGRNPHETLRVLSATQTDQLCKACWQEGCEFISAS